MLVSTIDCILKKHKLWSFVKTEASGLEMPSWLLERASSENNHEQRELQRAVFKKMQTFSTTCRIVYFTEYFHKIIMENVEGVFSESFLNCNNNSLHGHKVHSPALQRIASDLIFVQFFFS